MFIVEPRELHSLKYCYLSALSVSISSKIICCYLSHLAVNNNEYMLNKAEEVPIDGQIFVFVTPKCQLGDRRRREDFVNRIVIKPKGG